MNIHEYQARRFLKEFGLPVPARKKRSFPPQ
jgi:succinyl-CoA synthetase beta subunit